MRPPLIIHHCDADGLCGAMVIWLGLGGKTANAELLSAQYGEPRPPDADLRDREIWIVDFSYLREVLLEVEELASKLTVLDHHETAQTNCEGLDFCTFDMERSGAMLAWDAMSKKFDHRVADLFKSTLWRTHLYELVCYVQDRDLWRHQLPDTKEVNAWLASFPLELDVWLDLVDAYSNIARVLNEGDAILRQNKQWAKILIERAWPATLKVGNNILSIWVANAPLFQSEVAGELAEREGVEMGVAWFQRDDGKYVYSLRSRGELNVAEVAKAFGGGGHAKAAGFVSPLVPAALFERSAYPLC